MQNYAALVPGSLVDAETVAQIAGFAPVQCAYVQCRTPYACIEDHKSGKSRNTYGTFVKKHDQWIFLGNCFKGGCTHQKQNGDPWRK